MQWITSPLHHQQIENSINASIPFQLLNILLFKFDADTTIIKWAHTKSS